MREREGRGQRAGPALEVICGDGGMGGDVDDELPQPPMLWRSALDQALAALEQAPHGRHPSHINS